MLEAKPKNILPPKSEPTLRVGLVLPEDSKTSLTFSVTENTFIIQTESEQREIVPNKHYQINISDRNLVILEENKLLLSSPDKLLIKSNPSQVLVPQSGISLKSIVAGRGFHWQKEVDLTYPGDIEVSTYQNSLLLVTNLVSFEEYISCVITSEMSKNCPDEFIKAQAVAARSWALVFLGDKHPDMPFDICNDDDCQRYQGTTYLTQEVISAVNECRGEFLLTNANFVCPAYYSKSCGGHSEEPKNIFGFSVEGINPVKDAPTSNCSLDLTDDKTFSEWLFNPPKNSFCSDSSVPENTLNQYLGNVDSLQHYFRWSYTLEADTLIANLKNRFNLQNITSIENLLPGERSISGRFIDFTICYSSEVSDPGKLRLTNQYDIRTVFHTSFLFSSAFTFQILYDNSKNIKSIDFCGAGWGHGVGLCQIGALGMALQKNSYSKILNHYFGGCTIDKSY